MLIIIFRFFTIGLLFIFLASCAIAGYSPSEEQLVPTHSQLSTRTPQGTSQLGASSTPRTTSSAGLPTSTPEKPDNGSAPEDVTQEQTDAIEASSPAPFLICSPLAIHSLAELPEITSDPYRPPPPGKEERHHGIDFSYYRRGDRLSIEGVGVQSVMPGRVAAAIGESFPYGNVVIVETPGSYLPQEWLDALQVQESESLYTLYAHMGHAPVVSLGDEIAACQPLGEVGKSGNAAEPHLHLEMRLGPAEAVFTSMAFYGAKDTPEERSNYTLWRTSGEFRHFDPMLVLGVAEPETSPGE